VTRWLQSRHVKQLLGAGKTAGFSNCGAEKKKLEGAHSFFWILLWLAGQCLPSFIVDSCIYVGQPYITCSEAVIQIGWCPEAPD
jgi:hypothetical protein